MEIKLDYLPKRTVKPRSEGLTFIQDEGMSLNQIEDIISTSGQIIDFVRISSGALCSGEALSRRVDMYTRAGIIPFLSGIFFEAAYFRNSVTEYLDMLQVNNIGSIEVSDGIIEISPREKAKIINDLSKKFRVFSKVGAKYRTALFPQGKWKEYILAESEAGSEKLLIEGGEAGTSHITSGEINIKFRLVDHILNFTPTGNIIWEAPFPEQQLWYINKFGANVNLAEISPSSVLNLESMRSGIHWRTLLNHIPEHLTEGKLRKTDPITDIEFHI